MIDGTCTDGGSGPTRGWPLEPLNSSYKQLVEDVELRARGVLSWTPLSHIEYWKSGSFLKPVAELINELHAPA